jgi:hypothetical protein
VARSRTTKKLAQRIDLNYFKRPSPFKRARFWLCVLLPLFALVWISWRAFAGDNRVYSSGRMSTAHAVLEKECAECHVRQGGEFLSNTLDSTCNGCHDGPIHHATQEKTLACAVCHTEHRGRINISAVPTKTCAKCHSDLKTNTGKPLYQTHINSFEEGHPEFAAVRDNPHDPGTIKVNHYLHMKPINRSPTGPKVQMECGDCHRQSGVKAQWNYADAKYVAAKTSYSEEGELLPSKAQILPPHNPLTGRELMAPVKYATACASCHDLKFYDRIDDGAPHDKPEVVRAFVTKKFQDYIAAHPAELREVREPGRDLTGKTIPPSVQILTPAQWVAEHGAVAEEILWKKCTLCHSVSNFGLRDVSLGRYNGPAPQGQQAAPPPIPALLTLGVLPQIASSSTVPRWMPHSKFDHDAHRGFTCVSCHEKALTSKETFDVLLPGIATCQKCHAPGPEHAESRCFECHTYHDWSKRKEVTPKFTLPSLRAANAATAP